MIALIFAASCNDVIGKDGKLPWNILSDLKFFKQTTTGHPIIMGRKTYESIGRPLPGRTNIVLSSDQTPVEGIHKFMYEEAALEFAKSLSDKVFIIGGASIYKAYEDVADYAYITHVDLKVEGADTFFRLNPRMWREIKRSKQIKESKDDAWYQLVECEKVRYQSWELIKKLEEGYVLERYHAELACEGTEWTTTYDKSLFTGFYKHVWNPERYKDQVSYNAFGWGSAYKDDGKMFESIIRHPESWDCQDKVWQDYREELKN